MSHGADGPPCKTGVRRPSLEVADIFAAHGKAYAASCSMTAAQRRVMRDILACRTAVLGGHVDECLECGDETPSYNSCQNRHCPKCQSLAQARWIAARKARILPVPHFHVVFTLPSTLRPLANQNRKAVFDLLFSAASSTLRTFGADPRWLGGQIGLTAVLHTWTRDLSFHPHLHCIVTAGGLSPDGARWAAARRPAFLFPVRALGEVFRARMVEGLRASYDDGTFRLAGSCAPLAERGRFVRLLDRVARTRWHVYAKPPFGGAEHVMEYLGRYTHRVGLSNQRLLHHDDRGVRFHTKDGRTATLAPHEFIRRFLDTRSAPRIREDPPLRAAGRRQRQHPPPGGDGAPRRSGTRRRPRHFAAFVTVGTGFVGGAPPRTHRARPPRVSALWFARSGPKAAAPPLAPPREGPAMTATPVPSRGSLLPRPSLCTSGESHRSAHPPRGRRSCARTASKGRLTQGVPATHTPFGAPTCPRWMSRDHHMAAQRRGSPPLSS